VTEIVAGMERVRQVEMNGKEDAYNYAPGTEAGWDTSQPDDGRCRYGRDLDVMDGAKIPEESVSAQAGVDS